ncbi:MAG: 1,4-dihydroxy-2-naphthoate polyprenyltransferase [Myxococcota bacterium]
MLAPATRAPLPADTPPAWRVWLLATRPQTLTAAVAPVLVGTALAAADGVALPWAALAALAGAILIQIGTNLVNDVADFRLGADTSERLGPPRATQRGWLQPRQVHVAALVVLGASVLVGVTLVARAGVPVAVIGLASIACGVAYTAPPFKLGYRGLGDLLVLLFFGGVAVCGTYYVQALTVSAGALVAAVPVGLLATAILVVNNLRDRQTDAATGKRTLVARLGARFGRSQYSALLLAAYLVPLGAWLVGLVPAGWLLVWASAPVAGWRTRSVWRRDGAALNPELGATARLLLLYSALLALGVWL